MRKWAYPYLEVLKEQVRKMNEFFDPAERKYGKRSSLAVKTERISEIKASHLEVRKLNFILFAVQKCGSGTSHLWKSLQR